VFEAGVVAVLPGDCSFWGDVGCPA
jgi:hypothetical protein